MKISNLIRAVLLGVAATMTWALASGCSPSVSSYCDKVCECVGCSEPERADCVDTLEDYRKEAENAGCGSQFDDVLSCSSSELACVEGQLDADGCGIEADRLAECSAGLGFGVGVDPCKAAADQIYAKYDECGIEVSGGGGDEEYECTEALGKQSACVAACTVNASCGTLKGEDPDGASAYADCLNGC